MSTASVIAPSADGEARGERHPAGCIASCSPAPGAETAPAAVLGPAVVAAGFFLLHGSLPHAAIYVAAVVLGVL